MTQEQMQFVIERVVKYAVEANGEAKETPNDEFLQGKRQAYYEVLDTIKNQLEIYGANLKDYALNFDIENKMWT